MAHSGELLFSIILVILFYASRTLSVSVCLSFCLCLSLSPSLPLFLSLLLSLFLSISLSLYPPFSLSLSLLHGHWHQHCISGGHNNNNKSAVNLCTCPKRFFSRLRNDASSVLFQTETMLFPIYTNYTYILPVSSV